MQPPSEPDAIAAHCAVHPDQPADAGVCPRCGNFMCTGCVVQGSEVCATCHARLYYDPITRHLKPLAIVLMVHGGLILLGGMFALAYGAAMAGALPSMSQPISAHGPAALTGAVLVWALVGEGALHLMVGALQGWAGWRIRQYRSRWLGLTALLAGLLTMLGCYCLPTSVALLVWGLIVLLNPAVVERFDSGAWVLGRVGR